MLLSTFPAFSTALPIHIHPFHFDISTLFVTNNPHSRRQRVVFILLNPWVVLDFAQRQSILRLKHQQFPNKILRRRRHMHRESQIDAPNPLIRRVSIVRNKRRLAAQEFIGQHANAPIVNIRVVLLAIDHFRRQIIERTAHRVSPVGGRVRRPSEIGDFRLELREKANESKRPGPTRCSLA